MRIMGLDVGDVRIGVALSDPMGMIGSPHRIIDRKKEKAIAEILKIVLEKGVDKVVYGIPISLDGEKKRQVEKIEGFISTLKKEAKKKGKIEFIPYDERFTTSIAKQFMAMGGKKEKEYKKDLDSVAASILLQNYLDVSRKNI